MSTAFELRRDGNASASGTTLAQKLIARAAGQAHVNVGDVLTCQVDLAMFHDSSGPRRLKPMLADIGAEIWDKNKIKDLTNSIAALYSVSFTSFVRQI